MSIPRWSPRQNPTKQEQLILKRLKRVRKLFAFLRMYRHELFDDEFQDELESMYRQCGAGRKPLPPAMLAMAVLVQGYLGLSDAEMVELTVMDLRVQMVLDILGQTEPPFSQGALCSFRARMIWHDMDRRLLERTVKLARRTKGFDAKKLPGTLRVAIDSCPLEGAGKVEDTINLLGHAARKVVDCTAEILKWTRSEVCLEAGIPVLMESSVKKALDVDWSDPKQKAKALNVLTLELDALQSWLQEYLPEEMAKPPLQEHVETMAQLRAQDLEPDPEGGGSRIRKGVAPDRRPSVEDAEMRHGRKSKSKRFNGYKRHVAADIDDGLIYAAAVTPANRPEEEATPALQADMQRQEVNPDELYIDRAYINSQLAQDVLSRKGEVICKPWSAKNGSRFSKKEFEINVRDKTITCPAGHTETFDFGTVVEFNPDFCDHCHKREQCTSAELGHGRTVSIAENEPLQKRLRKLQNTKKGRARLRRRTGIEHRLAHIARRQGNRARYTGTRKNTFDLRRAAAIQNLETVQRCAQDQNLAMDEERMAG
jgi:hypothetical protein